MDVHAEAYFYRQKAEAPLPTDLLPENTFAHWWRPVSEPVPDDETFAYLEAKAIQILLADYSVAAPEDLFLHWWRQTNKEVLQEEEPHPSHLQPLIQILLSDYSVAPSAAIPGLNQRISYSRRRKRPYGMGSLFVV